MKRVVKYRRPQTYTTAAFISPLNKERPKRSNNTNELSFDTIIEDVDFAVKSLIEKGYNTFLIPAYSTISIVAINALLRAKAHICEDLKLIRVYRQELVEYSHNFVHNPARDILLEQIPQKMFMCWCYEETHYYSTKQVHYDTCFDEFLLEQSNAIIFDHTMYDDESIAVLENHEEYRSKIAIKVG